MPLHFSDLISSEVFEIVAESGKKRFLVHSSTLAKLPKPLRSTTTPAWTEATEKKIDLSGWDSDTIGRLVEFLYLGHYQAVYGAGEVKDGEGDGEGGGNGMDTTDMAQSFADQQERIGVYTDVDVLLAHAQVYALAQQEEIEGLKTMALAHLSTTLSGVKPEDFGEQPVMGKIAERLCDIGRYTQGWKDRVAVLDKKVLELEATNARLQQSDATNTVKVQELEAEMRDMEENVGFKVVSKKKKIKKQVITWDNALQAEEYMRQRKNT